MCLTTLYALVWSVGDLFVYVQDYNARLFHFAWFGNFFKCCNPRAHLVRELRASAKTECVLYLNRCVTARKFHPYRGGKSHHEPAYRKSVVRRHIKGRTLEIRFEITPSAAWTLKYISVSWVVAAPSWSHLFAQLVIRLRSALNSAG